MKQFKVNLELLWIYLASTFLCALCKVDSSGTEDPCSRVEIVIREEWNARPYWRRWSMKTPVNDVIIQHTVTPFCHSKQQCARNVEFMQEYHMDYLGWLDIGYNFMVGGDGRIYEGRGWQNTGDHSINFNTASVGIAFIGNYMEAEPEPRMLEAAQNLIACGIRKGYLTPTREIHGHRDVGCTLSPGDKLYAIIRTWKNYKGGRITNYDCSG